MRDGKVRLKYCTTQPVLMREGDQSIQRMEGIILASCECCMIMFPCIGL